MLLPEKVQSSLTDAIDWCLAGSYRDDSPMLRLSECLEELRKRGWTEDAVRHVELYVLKRLVGLPADESGGSRHLAGQALTD
jgi:hypothetical protein